MMLWGNYFGLFDSYMYVKDGFIEKIEVKY